MNLDLPSKLCSKDCSLERDESLFLSALHCRNFHARPPVWIMRQAGRYLPSYQKIRRIHSLKEMFSSPELIETITCLPVDELGVDAAILFADILHVVLPLGVTVDFPKTGGPAVSPLIRSREHLNQLTASPVEETLNFVATGITRLKSRLRCPLIGFCGGPFTIAYYLTGKQPKPWLYRDPDGFHLLLDRITQATIMYLKLQLAAGVDVLQIFDSCVHFLSKPQFKIFAVPYLKRILQAFPDVPVILFCRGSALFIDELSRLQPQGVGVDFSDSLVDLRRRMPPSMAIQGNFDPELLYADPAIIKKQVATTLIQMAYDPGFIVNLGHGILPDTPVAHVRTLIDTVKTQVV
ncbi:MAG: uroporphyrinogen decarboxylase [Chlamydiota bacterium]